MRTIKFRAWIKDKKKMIEWHPEFFSDMSEVTGYSSEFPDPEYVVLEQFTGLLDKNGKEIYEGDILKWDGSIIGVVKFKDAEFIVGEGIDARALSPMSSRAQDEIEAIGNIHS